MKLELKHLAPYLDSKLKVKHRFEKVRYAPNEDLKDWIKVLEPFDVQTFIHKGVTVFEWKPILRPLSDLTNEITVHSETFVPHSRLRPGGRSHNNLKELKDATLFNSYIDVQDLIKWHFDVFGLIDAGLAIDINTL